MRTGATRLHLPGTGLTTSGGGGSEPTLTVTDRVDGEAYTVTGGASRSLVIANPDGATLSTTVERASDGSSVLVSNAGTTSPSWTAPGGSDDGEAVQVRVSATLAGLSTSVSFTERIAGTGEAAAVTAPADTSQAVASGGSFAAVTFGSFTDPDGRIDASQYVATTTNSAGTTAWSGTGLGPYTASGSADGDAGVLTLTARNTAGDELATAVHSYSRAENVPTVQTVHDVDWPALWIANGSTDVDLSTAGTYTLDGTDYVVDQNHGGMTATLKSTGLHLVQTAGTATDWSIALATNQASVVDDYAVLTSDISATISSRNTTISGAAGLYGVGYTTTTTWGSNPTAAFFGAGISWPNAASQYLASVIRGINSHATTDQQAPKVNPTTIHHRAYLTAKDGAAGHKATAFDAADLRPTATYTNRYTNTTAGAPASSSAPYVHIYAVDCHPAIWVVGGTNAEIDLLVTATTWRAWPFPVP